MNPQLEHLNTSLESYSNLLVQVSSSNHPSSMHCWMIAINSFTDMASVVNLFPSTSLTAIRLDTLSNAISRDAVVFTHPYVIRVFGVIFL